MCAENLINIMTIQGSNKIASKEFRLNELFSAQNSILKNNGNEQRQRQNGVVQSTAAFSELQLGIPANLIYC